MLKCRMIAAQCSALRGRGLTRRQARAVASAQAISTVIALVNTDQRAATQLAAWFMSDCMRLQSLWMR